MPHGTASDADRSGPGAPDAATEQFDWTRIERSPEFRELTARRHRFIAIASIITFGCFATYLGLATFAVDLMGTKVLGGVPIAWLAAISQVLLTWAVTWTYLRKADREFAPLERRVAETAAAAARFTREDGAAPAPAPAAAERTAPAAATTNGRNAR
jgi:uncharacterized membrane protein (DUF485 family)